MKNQTSSLEPFDAEQKGEKELNETTCSRYVPSWMRDQGPPLPREVLYACGTEHLPGEFGMWAGPNPDEQSMLEQAGTTLNDVIIRFNADWTDDVLWRWDGSGWVLQSSANDQGEVRR